MITFDQLVDLARAGDKDRLNADYSKAFLDEVKRRLGQPGLTDAEQVKISKLPMTKAAISLILQSIDSNLNLTDTDQLKMASAGHEAVQNSYLDAVVIKARDSRTAVTGQPKPYPGAAAAGMPLPTAAPPAGHQVNGAPKASVYASGVGFIGGTPYRSDADPVVMYDATGRIPSAAQPYPQQIYMGGPATLPPPSYAGGSTPATVMVVAAAGTGPATPPQRYTPDERGCTCWDCCRVMICCLNAEQQMANDYTKQQFMISAMTGQPISRDVAVGALAGGRPGVVGAVGNNASQRVFCAALCKSCNSMSCCCPAPGWGCTLPAIACPDVRCPGVNCDGNPVVECLAAVSRVATNCFGFFGGVAAACTGDCGACATCCGNTVACVGGALGNIGEVAGACAAACGACAQCCGAVLECVGNVLPRR